MNIITSFSKTNNKNCVLTSVVCLLLSTFLLDPTRYDSHAAESKNRWAEARRRMIERDLRGRGIKDERVLAAMESVPRHLFVPEKWQASAYDDRPLPIGQGQTISQPYIVAFMTELLELQAGQKVLEVGTGSGYQTAVLAQLRVEVFSIEIVPALSDRASKTLAELGTANAHLKIGDGFFGWEENGPFDAILVTASAPKVPTPLWLQLREGGRLLIPLGDEGETQRLVRVRKLAGKQVVEDVTGVAFVPLTGAIRKDAR
ncbi:MAG TPA: protein-L-isoaspartate(D-aspartate) O-methyltransferase [Candidatus Binatia bacterium]|nr:protein-L-isoaspartate(D-aspartate) O-methyltransferase [Candidatus Binatia bacterium]